MKIAYPTYCASKRKNRQCLSPSVILASVLNRIILLHNAATSVTDTAILKTNAEENVVARSAVEQTTTTVLVQRIQENV